jgi:predicted MFS family arabinose efflux permease
MASFLVLHLADRGVGHGASVFSLFAMTVLLVRVVAGGLPDRFPAWRVALIAALLDAGGFALIAVADTLAVAAAGALVAGAGFSVLWPALASAVVSQVSAERRPAALAMMLSGYDLGFVAGAPLVGVAADLAGYGAGFAVAALIAVGAAAVAARELRRRRPAPDEAPEGAVPQPRAQPSDCSQG